MVSEILFWGFFVPAMLALIVAGGINNWRDWTGGRRGSKPHSKGHGKKRQEQ